MLIVVTYISCERDDICAESTETTPRMLVEFYNISNRDNLKNVSNLVVIGVDNNTVLSDDSVTNNITLPLRTEVNSTQYVLWSDYEVNEDTGEYEGGNRDTITLNYSKEDIYVSRACGYKTIYNNVTMTIEEANDDDTWIEFRESVDNNQSVEDETEAHFYIFH